METSVKLSGDQKGALPRSVTVTEPNRKKKDFSSFLAKTQPMKSHGLFVYFSASNFLFLSIKAFSFPCLWGLAQGCRHWIAILYWIWIKPIISASLFVSGQQYKNINIDQGSANFFCKYSLCKPHTLPQILCSYYNSYQCNNHSELSAHTKTGHRP